MLINRLSQPLYFEKSSEKIIEIIKSGGSQKRRLISLTECYVASLRDAGYPAQTIYHLLNVSFLNKTRATMTADARMGKFFSYFDLAIHSYTVYFSITEIAVGVAETFTSIRGISLEKSSPEAVELTNSFPIATQRFFIKTTSEEIVYFEDIRALDPQSARKIAERRLQLLDDLLKFSVHRKRFLIENAAVVQINKKDDRPLVHSNRPKPPILRVPHDEVDIGDSSLENFASIFRSSDSGSVNRFIRALELHGTALSASEEESQLLNIWIAFETLFVRKGEGSKIREVVESVEPYVIGCWIRYQFSELWSEINSYAHSNKWQVMIDSTPELQKYRSFFALAAVVAIKKYEVPMTSFLEKLDDDPLLRQRIFCCIKWAQSAKSVQIHYNNIADRIKSDINRIYRTRNQIVHAGKSTEGLGEVVQSSHYYLDIILNIFSQMLGRAGGPRTIEQANMEACVHRSTYLKQLKKFADADTNCDDSNFIQILFGRSLVE